MSSKSERVVTRFLTAARAKTPKDFYTQAQVKKEGMRIAAEMDFGSLGWTFHGVQSSNRKVLEGQEQALILKFYSVGNNGVGSLTLSAIASGGKSQYWGEFSVEVKGKSVNHGVHSGGTFEGLTSWVKSLPAG